MPLPRLTLVVEVVCERDIANHVTVCVGCRGVVFPKIVFCIHRRQERRHLIVDSPSVGIVIQPSVYALQVRQKIGRYLRRVGTKTTICIADGGGFTVCQGRRGAGIIQRYIVRHGYRVVLSKKHLVSFLLLAVQDICSNGIADEHPQRKFRVLERILCKVQLW